MFLNLGHFRGGLPQHYSVQFSYEQLAEKRTSAQQVQYSLSESFRASLVNELGLLQYQVRSPLELDPDLRTSRWQLLCDHVSHYPSLPISMQIKVIHLLGSLCFHRAIMDCITSMSLSEISSSPEKARLALLRAFSQRVDGDDRSLPPDMDKIQMIAENAPQSSTVRISAALQLLALSAYVFKDLERAVFWRSFLDREMPLVFAELDPFSTELLLSMYYRAAAFVPQLRGDRAKLIEEMDRCQAHSESLTGRSVEETYICQENKNVILESRAKEALWLNKLDLAEERTRKLIERLPTEPRYHLELGEVLLKQGRVDVALKAYLSAARLGPPGTAVAWFMSAQCYQGLGDLESAFDCHLASIHCDPLALSPVKRIKEIAPLIGQQHLVNWAELRLSQIEEQKEVMEANGSTFRKPSFISTKQGSLSS